MAVLTPPYVLQGGSHPAATFRLIQQAQMGSPTGTFAGGISPTTQGGGHGVCSPTDLVVTQNGTPNMSVNVAAGPAFIRGTESASQGVYGAYNDATVNLAVAASDPTNPRRDLVVFKVRDSFYSGASNDVSLAVVTGTAAAVPVDPTPPANSLVLYRISVAAAATSVVNANLADLRTRAAALGGRVPCTSTTRPSGAALFPGLQIFETDTFRELTYDGTGWIIMSEPPQTYTPVVTQGTAKTATIARSVYVRSNGWIKGSVVLTVTQAGVAGTLISVSQPIAPLFTTDHIVGEFLFFAGGTGGTKYSGVVDLASGSFFFWTSNVANALGAVPSYALANGDILMFDYEYQMTTRYS